MRLPAAFRRPLLPLLAGTLVLALPAPALADHGEAVGGPALTRYLSIAEAHWKAPAPTCTGAQGQTIPVHAAFYDDPDPGVVAAAEQPGCRIWLDRDWWPRRASTRDCVTIVHEWGHLLGHGHSQDPRSLMNPFPTAGATECSVFARPARARARVAMRTLRKRCRAERRPTRDVWSPERSSRSACAAYRAAKRARTRRQGRS